MLSFDRISLFGMLYWSDGLLEPGRLVCSKVILLNLRRRRSTETNKGEAKGIKLEMLTAYERSILADGRAQVHKLRLGRSCSSKHNILQKIKRFFKKKKKKKYDVSNLQPPLLSADGG